MDRDGAGGWAIWLRDPPSGPVLRFGPDERHTAERLFQQLEFLETLTLEPAPMPEHERDEPSSAVGIEQIWGRRPAGTDRIRPSASRPNSSPSTARRLRRASRGWPKLAKPAIAALAIAAFAYLATQLPLGADPAPLTGGSLFEGGSEDRLAAVPSMPGIPPDETAPLTLPGLEVHANREGGYLFSYPDSWAVEVQGGEAVLADPDESVRMVFGPARDGSLARVSASLVAEIVGSYDEVRVLETAREPTAQGLRALIVGGTLLRDEVAGRFLAIALEGPDTNRSISVYFSAGPDVLAELDDIRAILSSYRVAAGAEHVPLSVGAPVSTQSRALHL